MQMTTFRAVDAQEEGDVANGDEPWLMVSRSAASPTPSHPAQP